VKRGDSVLDEIDRKLILELQDDGRRSAGNLAKKTGISVSSVSRRIKRLLKDDVIKITAVPSPLKVGYNALAIIALNVHMEKLNHVCDKLVQHKNLYFIGISLGRYDILISGYFSSSEALVRFIQDDLSQIEGVKDTETFYIAELKKRTFGWLS
jgi:Lrp/AsnC family transcriptional regulator for asnA, asnC and gidA